MLTKTFPRRPVAALLAAMAFFIAAGIVVGFPSPSYAQPSGSSVKTKSPADAPILAEYVKAGYEVRYLTSYPDAGMDVWFTQEPQTKELRLLYTSLTGRAMFRGILWILKDGALTEPVPGDMKAATAILVSEGKLPPSALTTAFSPGPSASATPAAATFQSPASKAAQEPPVPTGKEMLAAFQDSDWVEVGKKSAPMVYMVIDPKCPVCEYLWKHLLPVINDGKIRVRVIITPVHGEASIAPAIAIRAASSPTDALTDWFTAGKAPDAPSPEADMKARQLIKKNVDMFGKYLLPHPATGLSGTPITLATVDGKIGVLPGVLAHTLSILSGLTESLD